MLLITDGAVTQTAALQADTLTLQGSGTYTLENSANSINTLGNVSRGGAFSLVDGFGGLTIDGTFSGTLSNSVTILTQGNLTLASGTSIVTSGSGNNITLVADAGSFINNAGASALTTDARFLIYSENNESPHEKGGLSGSERYEVSYGSDPEGSGNVFYYSSAAPFVDDRVGETPDETVSTPETPSEPENPVTEDPDTPQNPDLAPSETVDDRSDDSTSAPAVPVVTSMLLSESTQSYRISPYSLGIGLSERTADIPKLNLPQISLGSPESSILPSFEKPPTATDYYNTKLKLGVIAVRSGSESESRDQSE
ncbi:MAG: hypothetical protein ACPGN3_01405 [Opitutales bacterium]